MASKTVRANKKFQELLTSILSLCVDSKQYSASDIASGLGLNFERGGEERKLVSAALTDLVGSALLTKSNGKFIRPHDKEIDPEKVIVGVVEKKNGDVFVRPANADLPLIPLHACDAPDGHIVSVRPTDAFNSAADVVFDHGALDDEVGLCKLTALSAGIPIEFPQEVLEEVKNLTVPEPSATRKDFRHVPFITIDPVTAKDFDDAICVRKKGKNWVLMSAIADVDHYVKPGSALHAEALRRGKPIYFYALVIAMFPELLSNGICSLKPNEDRAAVIFTTEIDSKGSVVRHKIERGLIHSRARLHYDEVQDAIESKCDVAKEIMSLHNRYIKKPRAAYDILRAEKEKRGALNLNVAEQRADFSDDTGLTFSLEKGNESHGIIEELMIRANRTGTEILDDLGAPVLARVHGEPNEKRFNDNVDYLEKFGIKVDQDLSIGDRVRDVVAQAENNKNRDAICRLMIRVQARAKYQVGVGQHFGLALEKYGHFTSPIRRFADLINHRLLLSNGAEKHPFYAPDNLEKVAEHLNMTEQRGEDAERDLAQKIAAKFVENNMSEEFNGVVVAKDEISISVKISHPRIVTTIEVESPSKYKVQDSISILPKRANMITGIIEFKLASGDQKNATSFSNGVNGAGVPYAKKHPLPRKRKHRSMAVNG
ncbi:MAG: hypothetical protein COB76_02255 [Alphaproteobacteria bacterium]|nr:MAG: hypothetical protein COB76_02255 [Alphaproteobacteria bacterium]